MRFSSLLPNRLPADISLLVFAFEKSKRPVGAYLYGSVVEKGLAEAQSDGFTGKAGQVAMVKPREGKFRRLLFVGLGVESQATLEQVRRGTAAGARLASSIGAKSLALKTPSQLGNALELAQAAAEGVLLGLYRFTGFQSAPAPKSKLENIFCLAKDAEEAPQIEKGLARGTSFASCVCFARDLINRPPSDTTPEFMVKEARKLAGRFISIKVFNKAQITKMGMGALLGVNRGSHQPPYFIHLSYKPAGAVKRKIGICGKGITFDSGGLSLKPAASMETMKYDMSGAASVFAVFRALAMLKPSGVEVHGFTPLTENMPGGNAVKPGDVLRTMRGKTIEVLNTDAEGRLILADALSYASRQSLDEVIDIATLTGACVIALGTQIAGIMGTDPNLVGRLKAASVKAGEKLWELPLEKEYVPLLKSSVADLKNIGPVGQAGTILAGLFLKEFVDEKLPWAHLDIASTGWTAAQTALSEAGGTGVLIRTLLHHLLSANEMRQ